MISSLLIDKTGHSLALDIQEQYAEIFRGSSTAASQWMDVEWQLALESITHCNLVGQGTQKELVHPCWCVKLRHNMAINMSGDRTSFPCSHLFLPAVNTGPDQTDQERSPMCQTTTISHNLVWVGNNCPEALWPPIYSVDTFIGRRTGAEVHHKGKCYRCMSSCWVLHMNCF